MRTATRAALPLASACLFSGAAALVYQVLWTRQLTLVLGHTVAAVSTVLATFMAGAAPRRAPAAPGVGRVPPPPPSPAPPPRRAGPARPAPPVPLLLPPRA